MPRELSVDDVVEEIVQSVLATPARQRRLLSKTFWKQFGVKSRSKERVEQVRAALKSHKLTHNLDDAKFGNEHKDAGLLISYVQLPVPPLILDKARRANLPAKCVPVDTWFELMEHRTFESEREVECFFLIPLLESLGYVEDDFAIGYMIEMYEGVSKIKKIADIAVFDGNGREKDGALLVVEAKKPGRPISDAAVGQAKGYAMWLTTPYYITTNGQELDLYWYRGGLTPDLPLMKFLTSALHENWDTLYQHINKAAVIQHKARMATYLSELGL
jgi:hypothetical protein